MLSNPFFRCTATLVTVAALVVGAGATAGCSGGVATAESTQAGVAIPRVQRDVHMVLAAQPAGAYLQLEVGGTELPLTAHTPATLAAYSSQGRGLLATGKLPTHFVSGAPFSKKAPQSYEVVRIDAGGTRHLVLAGIHLPSAEANAMEPLTVDARESAKALVFRDPSLMTINPVAASRVMAHIEASPDFERLVESIAKYGDATSLSDQDQYLSGWAVTVVSKDSKGQPIVISATPNKPAHVATHWVTAGSPEYYAAGFGDKRDPSTREVIVPPYEILGHVQKAARLAVRADQALEGTMWSVTKDTTVRVVPQQLGAEGNIAYTVEDPQWKGDRRVTILETEGRKVKFKVENDKWRRQGVVVRFRDQKQQLIKKADLGDQGKTPAYAWFDAQLPYSRFLGVLDGRYTMLGIPFEAASSEEYTVELPEQASSFEVNIASVGLKNTDYPAYISPETGEPEPLTALPGEVQTLLLDVGLPLVALSMGAGEEEMNLPAGKELQKKLASIGTEVALKVLATAAASGGGVSAFSSEFATELIYDVLRETPEVAAALIKWSAEVGAEKALEASMEIVGLVLEAIDVIGTVAQLGETLGTIATTAPFTYDRIIASETLDIAVSPKAEGGAPGYFSKLSDTVAAYVYFGQSSVPTVVRQPIDMTQNGGNGPATIVMSLPKQPVGGEVRVKIALESKTGWISGEGEAEAKNEPTEGNVLTVAVTVEQNPTPIDGKTRYQHDSVLAYVNGKRTWVKTGAAPTVTAPQVCNTGDASRPWLCGASSMTFNSSGMLGYGWTGSGAELASCDSGATSVIGSMAQTLNVNPAVGAPEARMLRTSCGASAPVFVAFDPTGTAGGGRHVVVQKVAGAYQVYGIDISKSGKLDVADTSLTLGTFRSKALDEITLNPTTGVLLGLDKSEGAVEVLKLAASPLPKDKAPQSTVIGGPGMGIGRLHDAAGIAFLPAGAGFLVLESGENGTPGRIQAFTFDGASVDLFGGKPSFALNEQRGQAGTHLTYTDAKVTYTDMKIDPTESYVYVSSFVGATPTPADYRLDIYRIADGAFVSRTSGLVSSKMAIDKWRDLYTVNYANLEGATFPEPSISEWIAPPVEPGQ